MVDQLHISDRVLQHDLLKQLKPTFKHVMNPNCYHLHGPTGVKYATQRIRKVLQGLRRLLNIKCRSLSASFHTRERCERRASKSSGWSMMESLVDSTRNYLHRFVLWWVNASSQVWQYEELLHRFIIGIIVLQRLLRRC
jgi:hypothetical protein